MDGFKTFSDWYANSQYFSQTQKSTAIKAALFSDRPTYIWESRLLSSERERTHIKKKKVQQVQDIKIWFPVPIIIMKAAKSEKVTEVSEVPAPH